MCTLSLIVTSGPAAGRRAVRTAGRISVGRSSAADLRIEDPNVHWEHCAILPGAAPTLQSFAHAELRLNGRAAPRTARLHHGDVIQLPGDTRVRVELPGPSPRRRLTLGAAAALMVILAAAILRPDGPAVRAAPDAAAQYLSAYRGLERCGLEPAARDTLRELLQAARRLEIARDVVRARRAYAGVAAHASAIREAPPEARKVIDSVRDFALAREGELDRRAHRPERRPSP